MALLEVLLYLICFAAGVIGFFALIAHMIVKGWK